jgi:hypothetical protein
MPPEPVPANPGWDEDLAWLDRDPEREVWLDRVREHDDPPLEEEYADYAPLTAEELAGIREAAADELLAIQAATAGRRGPGQPGSARVFPGQSSSPAAAFGPGMVFDVLPGSAQLAVAADAAGEDRFDGVPEGELVGLMCAWDRVEAHAASRKLAVISELARRNPAPEDAEFTADEVANALGESRTRGYELMGTAGHLDTHLPGTRAALREGILSLGKARIITAATALLDEDEAAAAEAEVLDRAARLTPGGLRAAIARAVIKAAPKKAMQRRETAAKNARVERWLQDTGNAALMGCELPPAEALAADEQITARAKELRAAGLEGDMDQLRARAYLDLLLGTDSRPGQHPPGAPGAAPAGFAGRVTLTVPLATLAGLADRPGELGSLGPVDPWLARDLAAAAAASPKSTWCLTVTDGQGHAVAHGCARHEPKNHRNRAGPGPPAETGFSLIPAGRDGPPGGYGTWRLRTPRDRARPDHHHRPDHHRPLRPPARSQRPRPRRQAPAPGPDPARHLHQPHLPPTRPDLRFRAQHPLRSRRPDVPVQRGSEVPSRPSPQAAPQVDRGPAPRRDLPLDHPGRPHLRHRTHPLPDLAASL